LLWLRERQVAPKLDNFRRVELARLAVEQEYDLRTFTGGRLE
jgi:hypothetical protein